MEVPIVSKIKSSFLDFMLACIRHDFPRLGRHTAPDLGGLVRASHSPEDLSGLPPLLEAVAGQGYHCRWMRSWRGCLPRHPLGRMGTARHLICRFDKASKEKEPFLHSCSLLFPCTAPAGAFRRPTARLRAALRPEMVGLGASCARSLFPSGLIH